MSTSVAPSPAEPASRREVVTVTAAMLAAYAIMGFAVRGGALFFRPLWLDEWHTLFIARLESLNAVIHALARGADFNPPLLFVVQWLFAQAMGDASAWQLRLVAMLSIWGTLATLFVLLRGSFRLVPALVGVIAVGMNVNVIVHAFEGRFYGPWMLLTVVFIALVTRAVEAPRSLSRQIAACISAALLCLIHYFGIITLGLILIAVVSVWRPLRGAIAGVLPSALSAGLTCLALLPLFLGQRSALSVATWVPPASFFLVAYFLIPAVLILSAAWFILPPLLVRRAGAALLPLQQARVAALASVAALPLVLVLVSVTMQSVLVSRYAQPSLLALGPVAAGVATRVERRVALVMAVALGLTWVIAGVQQAGVSDMFANEVKQESDNLAFSLRGRATLVVPSRLVLYPQLDHVPDGSDRVVMPALSAEQVRSRFPKGSDSAAAGEMMLLERDVATAHRGIFGRPALVAVDSLLRMPCFLVLESTDSAVFAHRFLANADVQRVRPRLFMIHPAPIGQARQDVCESSQQRTP